MWKLPYFLFCLSFFVIAGFKQERATTEKLWVDSVFNSLTTDQKIGQLFMVATHSNRNETYNRYIEQLVENHHLGGLIFFQGGPQREAMLTNRYQAIAKVPLFIGIDGEWGLGMRLDSITDFPKQMTLGAIQDNNLIVKMGREIGRQCRLIGINVNFAPVADINSNPRNPAIGLRSFGENRDNVTNKSIAYMKGLQSQHVVATAKHFPGHGDTESDSHFALPVVSHSAEQLQQNDLYPFQKLIADSLVGIITGHLYVPVLDNTPLLASSLSEKVVTELLKNQMGFKGLVFTDAMNMQGVSRGRTAVEANIKALLAGNDILLYPENVVESIKKIKERVENGQISIEIINEKVRKILTTKYWCGLHERAMLKPEVISEQIETNEAIVRALCEASTTLLHNDNHLLPLKAIDTCRLASIAIGASFNNVFQQTLSHYASVKNIAYPDLLSDNDEIEALIAQVGNANTIIVSIHDQRKRFLRPFVIGNTTIELINRLRQKAKVIVCLFGSPYSLNQLPPSEALVCAYEDMPALERAVAQQLFGGVVFKGKLPISVEGRFEIGTGTKTPSLNRLVFGLPEQVGMSTKKLGSIDSLAQKAIQNKIFPGCQVLVARKGRVVYRKGFGSLSYKTPDEKVTNETLYDLASVTKVTATLQAIMFLNERGAIDLKQKTVYYLPELQNTNKANVVVEDLLLHRSGMIAFYPTLWERTRTLGGGLMPEYYSSVRDSIFSIQVAPKLFAKPILKDSVWRWIIHSPMSNRKNKDGIYAFTYSDLGLVVLQKIIERVVNQPIDEFLQQNFYEPLGMKMTGFEPLKRFPESYVAPTEEDYSFRNQLLQGTVHDQMAAVFGGVAGHAGLFSTASDLAILMQMNLQKGQYGDRRYLQTETLSAYTNLKDITNHRGLGWDKAPANKESNYVAESASASSFGHSGFTGTMVWADPESELVFVFLSNRVSPRVDNNEINRQKIRKMLHEAVYQSIISTEK